MRLHPSALQSAGTNSNADVVTSSSAGTVQSGTPSGVVANTSAGPTVSSWVTAATARLLWNRRPIVAGVPTTTVVGCSTIEAASGGGRMLTSTGAVTTGGLHDELTSVSPMVTMLGAATRGATNDATGVSGSTIVTRGPATWSQVVA